MKDLWVKNIVPYLKDDDGRYSSARLAFFVSVFVAAIMSFAAIHLAYEKSLVNEYVFLTLSIWTIATIQKNWSKYIEKLK
jgi:hypothetical protein